MSNNENQNRPPTQQYIPFLSKVKLAFYAAILYLFLSTELSREFVERIFKIHISVTDATVCNKCVRELLITSFIFFLAYFFLMIFQ
jgi:hypothetical protein